MKSINKTRLLRGTKGCVEGIVKWRRGMIWAWAVLSALWCVFNLVPLYFTTFPCICDGSIEYGGIEALRDFAVVVVPPFLVLGAGALVAWIARGFSASLTWRCR